MSQKVCRNVNELVDILDSSFSRNSFFLIAIDGMDGTGKTHLARELAEKLSIGHIELDTYLNKNMGGYINHLKYGELKKSISQAKNTNSVIIVEGLCVLQVLKRIAMNSDILIYAKKVRPNGYWPDEMMSFPPDKTVDQVIADEIEDARKLAILKGEEVDEDSLKKEGMWEDLVRYHYKYNPHNEATYIFERIIAEA